MEEISDILDEVETYYGVDTMISCFNRFDELYIDKHKHSNDFSYDFDLKYVKVLDRYVRMFYLVKE